MPERQSPFPVRRALNMNAALLSLLALLTAIILSMVSRLNVGLVALGLAWLIGVYIAGMSTEVVMAGFPVSLLLTITGVTLLFACAEENGTLKVLAAQAIRLARGRRWALPLLFFLIATILSMVGPGSISSVALIIPLAMAIGERARLPWLLIALMVTNGANAGNLSPFSSVGVIANSRMAAIGLGGHEWRVFLANLLAHAFVSGVAFLLFGGLKLTGEAGDPPAVERPRIERSHWLTIAIIGLWIIGVVFFKLSLGLSTFVATTLLILLRAGNEGEAIRLVPWNVVLMVTGVATLIALMEKTGGLELFTTLLARLASPWSVNGVMALITGVISTYSSTSGVVLPAFLPTIPNLIQQIGGGDPLALALSINVGSALVDVSPLSTLGAMCVAAVKNQQDSRRLFNQLLLWGISMTLVGAIICQLLAGWFARVLS
jgi:Na+/H+ antiporter NhaD/arsenite permease-like protein